LLSAILKSRPNVTLIAGRRTARGEPLAPSRLLLACDDDTLVNRIRLMCKDQSASHPAPMIGQPLSASETHFKIPPLPMALQIPERLNITAFKDYIACPFRFALKWILNLEGFDDNGAELDPLGFGTLAHEVLHSFGTDALASNLTDSDRIEKFLLASLAGHSRKKFGDEPRPAVRLQIARLEQRLHSFAQFQARHRADGWVIHHSEWKPPQPTSLEIPGERPMLISGRIDRIDQHESTGEWLILDYKTSESGETPHMTHLGREKILTLDELEWEDLQLPLYWFLARQHGITGTVKVGYLVLPKRSDGVELLTADWSPEHLENAIDKAREIVRDIRAGKFAPNKDFHGPFDDFARICQTLVFENDDAGDEVASA
jgi:hypothetical protein